MNINWTEVAAALSAAAQIVESPGVTALATLGGPTTEGIVAMVQGLAQASGSILTEVQDAATAIESGDLNTILAADAKIQAQNAALAAQIAAS